MGVMKMKPLLLVMIIHVLLHLLLNFHLTFGSESDTLYPGQYISGNQKITSRSHIFQLGIFDDTFAITYTKSSDDEPVVWSQYFGGPCPELALSINGDLLIHCGFQDSDCVRNLDGTSVDSVKIYSSIWKSDFNSTKLVLEDSGNLVLRSISDPTNILWQSFDHPKDVWLPGAKVGFNKLTNTRQVYHSFELDSKDNDSIIINGPPYVACRFKGFSLACLMELDWYSGEADMILSDNTHVSYVSTENETYFTYSVTDPSVLTFFRVDPDNNLLNQFTWSDDANNWIQSSIWRLSDTYCNQFAVYNDKREFYHGSEPRPGSSKWSIFQCHEGEREGFVKIQNAAITPARTIHSQHMSLQGCDKQCSETIFCRAYAYGYWGTCTLYIQHYMFNIVSGAVGLDIYVQLATRKVKLAPQVKPLMKRAKVGATIGGISLICIILMLVAIFWKRRRKVVPASQETKGLLLMRYSILRTATKNFSAKLGEGGFGTVFKGHLPKSSHIIAVKQLKLDCQGEKQFRAEIRTLGVIHHVNLVGLKGFCVHGTKRYLVYDYMPHGSLDKHIFGDSPSFLDWETRYQIALGVAKGLAYLHEECRECIIHLDIKPENILLDAEFRPKIADFGLAKLLGRDFSRVLTTMRGTRGYLAPEWISGVPITSKVDVYSYGMVLFEIMSGRRNWCLTIEEETDYCPFEMMQQLASGGEMTSLLDSKIQGNSNAEEVIRICRVAGWCIQDDENDRPSMVHIVQILEGVIEVVTPPMPKFMQFMASSTLEKSQNES